jgi:hypothetical protein
MELYNEKTLSGNTERVCILKAFGFELLAFSLRFDLVKS